MAVETSQPVMALTFDDGPDPEGTPAVLDELAAAGARATFFLLGTAADRQPALVRRIEAEGHEIALHSNEHVDLATLPPIRQLAALHAGRRAVTVASGRRPRLFRAPYGKQTAVTVLLGRALRMRPVMWSGHAAEWTEQSLAACVEQVCPDLRRGAIILLHDGAGGRNLRPRRPVTEVRELVRSVLELARAEGLRVVPVGELLATGPARRELWFRSWRC